MGNKKNTNHFCFLNHTCPWSTRHFLPGKKSDLFGKSQLDRPGPASQHHTVQWAPEQTCFFWTKSLRRPGVAIKQSGPCWIASKGVRWKGEMNQISFNMGLYGIIIDT